VEKTAGGVKKPPTKLPSFRPPQFYCRRRFQLAAIAGRALYGYDQPGGICNMATFNRIFTTERLIQIIVILGATIIMKLLS
jgi:hypothetical protein